MNEIKLPEYWTQYLDYDSNSSGCLGLCNDDYCRCSTVSPTINEVKYDSIYCAIVGHFKINNIKEYCIERVIRKILSVESFDAYGVPGYYGEETEISLSESDKNKLLDALNKISKFTDTESIEYILTLEYGFVLNDLKNKTWHFESIKISDVTVGYKAISENIVVKYKLSHLNNCIVCIKQDDHYRLIDGIHRYTAYKQNDKRKISSIYCLP